MLVQALIAQPSVEALDKPVLHRLAGRDVMPFDAELLLPGQDSIGGELGAVVADDHAGTAAAFDDLAKFSHHTQGGERGVDDQAEALPGEVIDQGQDAEAPAAGERVHHEVERPAQVLILRDRHRRPRAQRPFTATTLAHRQPLLVVEPVQLLPIDPDPLPSQ